MFHEDLPRIGVAEPLRGSATQQKEFILFRTNVPRIKAIAEVAQLKKEFIVFHEGLPRIGVAEPLRK